MVERSTIPRRTVPRRRGRRCSAGVGGEGGGTIGPVAGAPDLAQVDFGDGRTRIARVRHDGVWTSLLTEPDIDHVNRVEVLDFAATGKATLVVNDPGTAVGLISRTGTCAPAKGTPE